MCYTDKKGVFLCKKYTSQLQASAILAVFIVHNYENLASWTLISTEALSATHLINDKVWDIHEFYQIHQKSQCDSEGIDR